MAITYTCDRCGRKITDQFFRVEFPSVRVDKSSPALENLTNNLSLLVQTDPQRDRMYCLECIKKARVFLKEKERDDG